LISVSQHKQTPFSFEQSGLGTDEGDMMLKNGKILVY